MCGDFNAAADEYPITRTNAPSKTIPEVMTMRKVGASRFSIYETSIG